MKSLTELRCSSAGCLLPWDASHQQSCSQSTCGEELLFSHLNVEATPGETTKYARWRDRDGTVSFRGLQTASGFLPPAAVRVPAVSRLLVTEDASSEKRGQDASGDQLFHPPPQTQVTLTKAKVDPAGLR